MTKEGKDRASPQEDGILKHGVVATLMDIKAQPLLHPEAPRPSLLQTRGHSSEESV